MLYPYNSQNIKNNDAGIAIKPIFDKIHSGTNSEINPCNKPLIKIEAKNMITGQYQCV
jgi:hypothetical protein